jgi:hypothetical protein
LPCCARILGPLDSQIFLAAPHLFGQYPIDPVGVVSFVNDAIEIRAAEQ